MEANKYISIIQVNRADIGMLILRIGVAFIFLAHGALNLTTDSESINTIMTGLGFPGGMAYVIGITEITSAVMMLAGVLVAYAAWVQIVIAAGLVFIIKGPKGFNIDNGGYEYSLLILVASIAILLLGPGKFVLEKRWGNRAKDLREEGVSLDQHPLAT